MLLQGLAKGKNRPGMRTRSFLQAASCWPTMMPKSSTCMAAGGRLETVFYPVTTVGTGLFLHTYPDSSVHLPISEKEQALKRLPFLRNCSHISSQMLRCFHTNLLRFTLIDGRNLRLTGGGGLICPGYDRFGCGRCCQDAHCIIADSGSKSLAQKNMQKESGDNFRGSPSCCLRASPHRN